MLGALVVAALLIPAICLADSLPLKVSGRVTLRGGDPQSVVQLELFSEGKGGGVKDMRIETILETIQDRFAANIVGPTEEGASIRRFFTIKDADHTDFYQVEAVVELVPSEEVSLNDIVGFFSELLEEEPAMRAVSDYTGDVPKSAGVRVKVEEFTTLEAFNRQFNAFKVQDTLLACLKRFCARKGMSLYRIDNMKTVVVPAILQLKGTLLLTEDVPGFTRWYVITGSSFDEGRAELVLSGIGPISLSRGEMLLNERYFRRTNRYYVPKAGVRYSRRLMEDIRFSGIYLCLPGDLLTDLSRVGPDVTHHSTMS